MEYRSVTDLNSAVIRALPQIPQDIDVVVGVPRSGMLPATLIALFMHRPLTDLNGLISGYVLKGGQRTSIFDTGQKTRFRKALIVDDSVCTGHAIAEVKNRLAENPVDADLIFAAVFVEPENDHLVDIAFESVPIPRIFEWNMFNSWLTPLSCVDIDGVLCRDPTDEENDDGPNYLNFIQKVPVNFVPSAKIGHLVTCRLEKYRPQTEEWMRRHNIPYGELHMMQYDTGQMRQQANAYSDYKAKVYLDTAATLFIESDVNRSVEIARKSMKPVFCTDARRMFQPGEAATEGLTAAAQAVNWQLDYLMQKTKKKFSSKIWSLLPKIANF